MNDFPDDGIEQAETRSTVNNSFVNLVVRECGNSRRQVSRATKCCSSLVWKLLLEAAPTFLTDVCTPALVYRVSC
jgi:hypothetical protein